MRVLVATKAKPSKDVESALDREFYKSFLNVSTDLFSTVCLCALKMAEFTLKYMFFFPPFGFKVLNYPQQTGKFNLTTQFPYFREVIYKPSFGTKKLGRPVIFDIDMSAGDFLALFYLLKVPVEVINLKVETFLLCLLLP